MNQVGGARQLGALERDPSEHDGTCFLRSDHDGNAVRVKERLPAGMTRDEAPVRLRVAYLGTELDQAVQSSGDERRGVVGRGEIGLRSPGARSGAEQAQPSHNRCCRVRVGRDLSAGVEWVHPDALASQARPLGEMHVPLAETGPADDGTRLYVLPRRHDGRYVPIVEVADRHATRAADVVTRGSKHVARFATLHRVDLVAEPSRCLWLRPVVVDADVDAEVVAAAACPIRAARVEERSADRMLPVQRP